MEDRAHFNVRIENKMIPCIIIKDDGLQVFNEKAGPSLLCQIEPIDFRGQEMQQIVV